MATAVSQPDEQFAVKSFQLDNLSPEGWEELESEVQNHLSMNHPHIARLCDVYESEDQVHLVIECMEGGDLLDRVTEQTRFSEAEASDALRQMLLALSYMHSHGIAHRDIKLENFVYDKKDNAHLKLIDFGLSTTCDPSGQEKLDQSCGTLSYVAPEVLDNSYTSQCDLWSLGVVGFTLLSGTSPFFGSESEQMQNIRKAKFAMIPEIWKTISDEAKDFIFKLLEVDPSKRLTAQSALQHSWIRKSCDAAAPQSVAIEAVDALKVDEETEVKLLPSLPTQSKHAGSSIRHTPSTEFSWYLRRRKRRQTEFSWYLMRRRKRRRVRMYSCCCPQAPPKSSLAWSPVC
jgi:calcium-dependent protein kinase